MCFGSDAQALARGLALETFVGDVLSWPGLLPAVSYLDFCGAFCERRVSALLERALDPRLPFAALQLTFCTRAGTRSQGAVLQELLDFFDRGGLLDAGALGLLWRSRRCVVRKSDGVNMVGVTLVLERVPRVGESARLLARVLDADADADVDTDADAAANDVAGGGDCSDADTDSDASSDRAVEVGR